MRGSAWLPAAAAQCHVGIKDIHVGSADLTHALGKFGALE